MAFKREYTLDELGELQSDLAELAKKLEQASESILDEMADVGLKEMQNTYNAQPFKTPSYSDMQFFIDKKEKMRTIKMQGPQAIYSEFGTGTLGERYPHPLEKGQFGLKPYNSGRTIRKANEQVNKITGIAVGELYWTYKDADGNTHYTQGIPAGKEGYNAGQTIRKQWKRIARKKIEEITK